MICLGRPTNERLRRFLELQRPCGFTYAAVGATAAMPPNGFVVDRTRIHLGYGAPAFESAKDGLRRWEQFQLGWVEAWPSTASLRTGEVVAVICRIGGISWVNACRIAYVIDDAGPAVRFGFAYGTLPQHIEAGEEQFQVVWERTTDAVSYEILAFSRPRQVLSRLAYPLLRRLQKRFGRDSALAMFRAVNGADGIPIVHQSTG